MVNQITSLQDISDIFPAQTAIGDLNPETLRSEGRELNRRLSASNGSLPDSLRVELNDLAAALFRKAKSVGAPWSHRNAIQKFPPAY